MGFTNKLWKQVRKLAVFPLVGKKSQYWSKENIEIEEMFQNLPVFRENITKLLIKRHSKQTSSKSVFETDHECLFLEQ